VSDKGCEHFSEQITDYVCGGPTDAETNTMSRHLAECPACQQELEEYQRTLAIVDQAGLDLPPVGLAEEMTARVLAELSRVERRPIFRFGPRAVAAVAACLLAGLFGVFFVLPGNANRELEEQVAAVTAEAESVLWLVHEIEKENEAFLKILAHDDRPLPGVMPAEAGNNQESPSL